MYLLYINELGQDYKGQRQYEFIFGNDPDTLVEEWFIIPSAGRAIPPEVESIDLVGLLKNSDLKLELVQNSDYFGVIDAVDGIMNHSSTNTLGSSPKINSYCLCPL